MKRPAVLLAALVATSCGDVRAQVVQLPTFGFFSVQTTVMVPDSGAAFTGAVRRARYDAIARGTPGLSRLPGPGGLFGNRGISSSAGTTGTHVTATIIDHRELDEALLAEAASRRPARERTESEIAVARWSEQVSAGASSSGGLMSVAEIRRRNAARHAEESAEARKWFDKGVEAEAKGHTGAARLLFKRALGDADSALREQIAARLKALDKS